MNKLLMFLCIFPLANHAAPNNDVVHHQKKCRPVMKKYGLTGRFPGAVSHGIHSITLEDIQFYFKSNATEKNRIPTINYNLNDSRSILPNAPLYGYDTTFRTIGMRHVDQVLMNMNRKDFYLTGYTTLEQLVHTFHMSEVWAKTKVHYDKMSSKRFDDATEENILCECVTDIDNNGIIKMLSFMHLKIKYPGLTSGKTIKMPDGGDADWSGNIYKYHFANKWSKKIDQFNFNRADKKAMLHEASQVLQDGDEGLQHLKNKEVWKKWKFGMRHMVEHDDYELAVFLYCSLKNE